MAIYRFAFAIESEQQLQQQNTWEKKKRDRGRDWNYANKPQLFTELLDTERMNMGTEWESKWAATKKKYMVEQITGILFSTSFWARTSSILKNIQITQFRKKTNGEWMYLAGDLSIVFYVVRLNE